MPANKIAFAKLTTSYRTSSYNVLIPCPHISVSADIGIGVGQCRILEGLIFQQFCPAWYAHPQTILHDQEVTVRLTEVLGPLWHHKGTISKNRHLLRHNHPNSSVKTNADSCHLPLWQRCECVTLKWSNERRSWTTITPCDHRVVIVQCTAVLSWTLAKARLKRGYILAAEGE